MNNVKRGFTLIELLMVIAIIVVLATVLLPVLSKAKLKSQVDEDLNNKKQLMLAWLMYASDNNDTLELNSDASAPVNGSPSWVSDRMDWTLSPQNTNTLVLATNQLSPYCSGQYKIYTSPGDNYLSPLQRQVFGGAAGRARSVAMDAAVGGCNPTNGQAGNKPPGNLAGQLPSPFFYASKTGQLIQPGPSDSWVFINENPDSIDDGILYDSSQATSGTGSLIEMPSSYLGGGCGVSFADGHAEVHKWNTSAFIVPVIYQKYPKNAVSYFQNEDLAWLAVHTPGK